MELTQAEMASSLGVNIGALRKYEIGLNAPGGLILAVACHKGLNISWLLTGNGPMLVSLASPPSPQEPEAALDELCLSLGNLQALDATKYDVLLQEFIARSVEASEHVALKLAAGHLGVNLEDSLRDFITSTSDLETRNHEIIELAVPEQVKSSKPD